MIGQSHSSGLGELPVVQTPVFIRDPRGGDLMSLESTKSRISETTGSNRVQRTVAANLEAPDRGEGLPEPLEDRLTRSEEAPDAGISAGRLREHLQRADHRGAG